MSQATTTFSFDLPKNTTVPISRTFEIWQPLVKKIHVVIPKGHKALAGLNISAPGSALVPASGSNVSYVYGDEEEKDYYPDIVLPGPPYILIFKGYNNDPFLSHSFNVSVSAE